MPALINSRITLKNVKTFPAMSEETLACRADVYFDGKLVGEASCSGRGDGVYLRALNQSVPMADINAEAVKQRPPSGNLSAAFSLEFLLADMIDQIDCIKRETARTKRDLKTKTFVRRPDGTYITLKAPSTHPQMAAHVASKYPGGVIVHDAEQIARDLYTQAQ